MKSQYPALVLLAMSLMPMAWAGNEVSLVAPASVGFSSDRLKRLDAVMQKLVDEREYAGVVTLVARHGKVVHFKAFGKKDLSSGAPTEKDTIFGLFSMSKPITAAAMMILYEEGKWAPSDPIAKFIPQFSGLKVYKESDRAGGLILEEPTHPPTMRELMTHTAGFTYGQGQTPVDRLYRDEKDQLIFATGSLQAMIDRLAQAPLQYQPGSRWVYSLSVDIQGYIIEKLSGMTLPQFMQKRLFEPLGMKATGFHVPKEKQDQLATLYHMGDAGMLEPVPFSISYVDFSKEPPIPSGGGGLVSTAADYFRFAQMLLNGGELEGVRILGPQTVKLMMSNQFGESLMREIGAGTPHSLGSGVGHGFNATVVTDPGQAGVPLGKGSYFGSGAASTWFWIDPANDIVVVGMAQRFPRLNKWQVQDLDRQPNLSQLSMGTIYQALLRPDL